MRTKFTRRGLIGVGIAAGASTAAAAPPTARQTEGPFYPTTDQADKDADLTRVAGRSGRATGEIIVVEGRVLDETGAPIAGAIVDVWQANAHGRYAHERDSNPAPLDPAFQGWAILTADAEGRYRFRTVLPGAYPAETGWDRPPHIHFKVARRGFREITTQMYFEGQALNDIDRLLAAVPEPRRSALIARASVLDGDADGAALYRFDVTLAKV